MPTIDQNDLNRLRKNMEQAGRETTVFRGLTVAAVVQMYQAVHAAIGRDRAAIKKNEPNARESEIAMTIASRWGDALAVVNEANGLKKVQTYVAHYNRYHMALRDAER